MFEYLKPPLGNFDTVGKKYVWINSLSPSVIWEWEKAENSWVYSPEQGGVITKGLCVSLVIAVPQSQEHEVPSHCGTATSLSLVSCGCDKTPWQCQLKGQRVYWLTIPGYSLWLLGKSRQQELEAATHILKQELREKEMHDYLCSSPHYLLSTAQVQGKKVPPAVGS